MLLDVDLFIKYRAPEKAFAMLTESISRSPRSVDLVEKLREISISQNRLPIAARACMTLASLYIAREDFDMAYDRLQKAKLFDPRISAAPGLAAIRRARRPDTAPAPAPIAWQDNGAYAAGVDPPSYETGIRKPPVKFPTGMAFAGDLSYVGFFDVIQAIENSRLTGRFVIKNPAHRSITSFNEGLIVDALCGERNAKAAFEQIVQVSSGSFEFTSRKALLPWSSTSRAILIFCSTC